MSFTLVYQSTRSASTSFLDKEHDGGVSFLPLAGLVMADLNCIGEAVENFVYYSLSTRSLLGWITSVENGLWKLYHLVSASAIITRSTIDSLVSAFWCLLSPCKWQTAVVAVVVALFETLQCCSLYDRVFSRRLFEMVL